MVSASTTGEYFRRSRLLLESRENREKKSLTRRLAGVCRVPCSTVHLRRETRESERKK